MPKGRGQKRKLLFLQRYFWEQTDENHPISMPGLLELLKEQGIDAERKSVYDDIETLRLSGMAIELRRAYPSGYYLATRPFDLPELKLLADAVQSCKFITHQKSEALIRKLERHSSCHQARRLHRELFVADRVKSMSESIHYNIDRIHEALANEVQISFVYYEWGVDRQQHYHQNGARYHISPWAMVWAQENYYLIGYDSEVKKIQHYRVDKMQQIDEEPIKRQGQALFACFDPASYCTQTFGMFGGQEEIVRLEMKNQLVGVLIDRFGRDCFIAPTREGWFAAVVKVAVSPQFYGWVFSFGEEIRLIGPSPVVDGMCNYLRMVTAVYAKTTSEG